MTTTRKKLVWQDPSNRVVPKHMIIGHFAMWAVRQSPYLYPDELIKGIKEFSKEINTARRYTEFSYIKETTCAYLVTIVYDAITNSKTVTSWNIPKTDSTSPYVTLSRYDKPATDDDFIDLHALARNIAYSVWLELCYNDGAFEIDMW